MYTLTFLLLAAFSLYIGIWAFVKWDASWLRNGDLLPVQALLILAVVILLFFALLQIWRFLGRQSEKSLKRLAVLSILIITAGQLILLLLVRPMLRYDPLKTFDMAVEMLHTHTISPTYETGYFARYTNNYPITILTYWLLRLCSAAGIPEDAFMLTVQLLNIGCISLSIWLGYRIVQRLRDSRRAVFYLAVCVLCPLSYVWAGFFYTTTCSMPFMMGILYLSLCLPKARTGRKRCFYGALMGFLAIFGFKLRATALIALIAVGITAGRKLWKLRSSGGFGPLLRRYAGSALAFLLTVCLSLGFWSAAVSRYVKFDYQNTGFPMIHWVMMGARWDGSFDQTDEFYTSGFATKEEKINADKKVLLERITEAGPLGLVSLAGRKLLNTWVDGTDNYLPENSYCTYSKFYDYTLGSKSGPLTVYAQSFRALQMLTIGLSCICALYLLRKKQSLTPVFLLQLTLLGAMAFHLIWETSPLYSIGFTFLCLILLADGIASVSESSLLLPGLGKGHYLCAAASGVLLVLLVLGKKELVETPIESRSYCVDQYQYAGVSRGYVTDYEAVYTQTFTTDRPFNRISIRAVNPAESNQSAFLVRLTDENGNLLYDNDRFQSGKVAKNTPYEFELAPVAPDGPTKYTLTITPGYIEEENSLEFLSYHTGNYDMYPGGSLSIAGEEQKNGDLAFAVYEYKVTTYFSLKFYLALCTGLMLLAAGITCLTWRRRL